MRYYYYDFGDDYSSKGYTSRYAVLSRPDNISIDALLAVDFSKRNAERVLEVNSNNVMRWAKNIYLPVTPWLPVDLTEASFLILGAG